MSVVPSFLAGGGEAGARARSADWAATPLGPPETWSPALRATVALVLHGGAPMLLWWGPEQVEVYNDAFLRMLGAEHAMGQRLRDGWPDAAQVLAPLVEQPLRGGPPSVAEHVALPFGRGLVCSPVPDDTVPGTGVGGVLAIITAEPRPLAAPSAARGTDELAAIGEGGARIVIADADADLRDFISRVLRARGYAVEAVGDGEAAVARVRARQPELVLCDLGTPGLDGLAVIRELRRDLATAAIPVILLLTGEDGRIDGRVASDYLAKPFSARELVARVQAQLAASQLRRVEADARARLDTILMQAPVAIAVYRGPTHIYELANERAMEVIGAGDLIGRPIAKVLPAPDNEGLIAALDHVYQTGEPFIANDFAVRFARGGEVGEHRFQLHLVAMRDPHGVITGLLTIGVEITEVVTARAEAERANRVKDEFLAILGHELRNPLAPILTALDVMRLRDPGACRELAVIERQTHHLVRLVDDLLDVSRITQGKLALHQRRLELAHVVARAVETATPLLEQRGHELIVDVPAGLIVYADLERLAQAVSNLLTNAAKYTERGGRVTVSAHRAGGELALTVRDTGIGIAPEMLPRVFDMFVQERQALDRSSGGLGLGLTIVRSLVALHGGRVAVSSAGRDLGSEFTITLPVGEAHAEPAPAAVRPTPTPGTGRLLLVDDNVDAADMLSTSLSLLGYDTQVAHDGPEALRVVQTFKPDVAVLDIGLPVMDGYELAGRLRALPNLSSLRLVALTGYGAESDRRRSASAGFDAHLVKPVSLDHLRTVLAGLTSG